MDWKEQLASLTNAGIRDAQIPKEIESAPTAANAAKTGGKANIYYERKGRGGKEVTIIAETTLSQEELVELASRIKKSLGTGGSCRGGEILIQGDRRQQVKKLLNGEGIKTNI